MPALFALTMFLSATLLFMVQPMVGKMVLPHVGGNPAVWNTCMVFFQALLLGGYWYAHKLTNIPNLARQVLIHAGVLATAGGALLLATLLTPEHSTVPILKSLAPEGGAMPFFAVISMLAVAIGLPFLAVSTSAPLLQRWFTVTGHPSAKDPYFLYAASNAGSLISLLGYPLFTEPTFRTVQQTWLWAGGFLILLGLSIQCGRAALNPIRPPSKTPVDAASTTEVSPGLGQKLRWLGRAFVPSSLMLGVTTHMTTDIASVPLLWVIPLALYLLTFIIAFARTPAWYRLALSNAAPVAMLLLIFIMTARYEIISQFQMLGLHLFAYFLFSLLMHTELAGDRPHPQYLTDYFLWISFGGVLGGLFNAIVAPMLFPLAYEYPIAIVVGCMLIPKGKPTPETPESADKAGFAILLDILIPLLMLAFCGLLYWMGNANSTKSILGLEVNIGQSFRTACGWVADSLEKIFLKLGTSPVSAKTIVLFAVCAPPCLLCFLFIERPVRFGLCVAAIFFSHYYRDFSSGYDPKNDSSRETIRSYFGIMKIDVYPQHHVFRPESYFAGWRDADNREISGPVDIEVDADIVSREMSHGTTLHGRQFQSRYRVPLPRTDKSKPVEYYPDFAGFPPMLRDDILLLGVGSTWESLALIGARESWQQKGQPLTYYHPKGPVGSYSVPPMLRDDLRLLGVGSTWESLALIGARESWEQKGDPLTYYHRTGPVGSIFREAFARKGLPRVGMVGLGTGSGAGYAIAGQSMTFYEIDPAVKKMIESGKHFTYVTDARQRGANVDIVMGDARLMLEKYDGPKYDLLLIDAFSSDSIPVHLLTVESVKMYRERLAERGLLALHVSNRYLRLEPIVAAIAEKNGMACRIFADTETSFPGKTESSWVVLAGSEAELGPAFVETLAKNAGADFPWKPIEINPEIPAWTDDFQDILRVIRSKELQSVRRRLGLPTPVRD